MAGTMNKGTLNKGSLVKTFGGSGSSPTPPTTQGEYFVKVIDYDGTVLDEQWLDDGAEYTLPANPDRTDKGLVFQEWSCSQDIVNGKVTIDKNNVMIGAIYTTVSGQSEFDIELNSITGLSVTLKLNGTKDWGDGTTDTNTSHTYSQIGKYTIKCDGTTMTTSSSSGLFGQSNNSINYYCTSARLVVASIGSYGLRDCFSLKSVTMSKNTTTINSNAFQYDYSLLSIVIPSSVTSINATTFGYCSSLTSIVIPSSVTSIGDTAFQNCYSLDKVSLSSNITSIGVSVFSECSSLTSIIIPSKVSSISDSVFYNCRSLTSVSILGVVTSIGSTAFQNCYSLKTITIPNSVTSIGGYAFQNCYSLKTITIPNSVTSIGGYAFSSCQSLTSVSTLSNLASVSSNAFSTCFSVLEYDFSSATVIPTLDNTSAFANINKLCKIKVPTALYDEWIATNNWSTYANYIVAV